MYFKINIQENFRLDESESIKISSDINYSIFPMCKGVYVFHIGQIDQAWKAEGNIIYIGAASREKLRVRIRKNCRSKVLKYLHKYPNNVFVSYCQLNDEIPDFYPFLFENHLLSEYKKRYEHLPPENKGHR